MELEKIKELVKILHNNDYKNIFGAMIIFEKMDYLQELEDLDNKDMETLENIYNKYMDSKTITGLLNEEINDIKVLEELQRNKELQNALVSELLMKKMEDNFDDYLSFIDYSADGGQTYSPFVVKGIVQIEDLLADPIFLQNIALVLFKACAFFTMQSRK